jgi:hypothetical protein
VCSVSKYAYTSCSIPLRKALFDKTAISCTLRCFVFLSEGLALDIAYNCIEDKKVGR